MNTTTTIKHVTIIEPPTRPSTSIDDFLTTATTTSDTTRDLNNAYKQTISSMPTTRTSRTHTFDSKKKIQQQKPTSNKKFDRSVFSSTENLSNVEAKIISKNKKRKCEYFFTAKRLSKKHCTVFVISSISMRNRFCKRCLIVHEWLLGNFRIFIFFDDKQSCLCFYMKTSIEEHTQ
jgi:hypothetical protein